ncbi:hypothetical protein ACK8P5_26325 (plasmid) [Paenibacillus sp. EC2-1]|uniref:hypothetical protein n=1 Tax=Paenibacillus sp. EC2-1 TaxID=3388665 RepID=UPI003BEF05EE
MATAIASPDNLLLIARLIKNGELKTLRIGERKSGSRKGETWIDYTKKDNQGDNPSLATRLQRQRVSETLEKAASHIANNNDVTIEINKVSATKDQYKIKMEASV